MGIGIEGASRTMRAMATVALGSAMAFGAMAAALPAAAFADARVHAGDGSHEVAATTYRHGSVVIDADTAKDGIITLKAGQTATISVSPVAHLQYMGCDMWYCPASCGDDDDCFVVGMGCKCNQAPYERDAQVTSTSSDTAVATVGQVAPDSAWKNADNETLSDAGRPVTKDGTITVTALKAGETKVAVKVVTDADGSVKSAKGNKSKLLAFWNGAEKTYTIKVEAADPTPAPKPESTGFKDVAANDWVFSEGWLTYATEHKLMTGYNGSFAPEGALTRGQVAAILYRIANPDSDATTNPAHYGTSTGFSDGGSQRYYFAAVKWLKEQGISTGDRDSAGNALGTFRPDAKIARQELSTLVYRFAQKQGVEVDGADASKLEAFKDGGQVQPYAREAMAWCNDKGIITGGQGAAAGLVMPGQNATRAQAAKIFTVLNRDVLGK